MTTKTLTKAQPGPGPGPQASRKAGGSVRELVVTILQVVVWVFVIRTFAYEPFNIPSGSMIPTLLVGDYVFVSKFSYGYSRYSFPLWNPPFSGRIFGSEPKRGDVVVFRPPSNPSQDFIKRVVGLPGDRIQVRSGQLYINDVAVPARRIEDYPNEQIEEEADKKVCGYQLDSCRQFHETLPPSPGQVHGREHEIIHPYYDGAFDDPNIVRANNTEVFEVPPDHFFAMGDNRDNSEDSRFADVVGYVPMENLVGRAQIRFFSYDSLRAPWWEFWEWPFAIRWSRLFTVVR